MSSDNSPRWAIFTTSVLSPVDNPDAYLWRALGTRLRQLGHEATFFEPRGNAALRALLQRSGSNALKDFRIQHPDIEYRTLEPKQGAEFVLWMTRILATTDVALIQSSTTADFIEWLGKLTRPHLQTFFVDTGWNEHSGYEMTDRDNLQRYSSVLVGSDRLIEPYETTTASAVAVHSFGPLPNIDPGGEPIANNASALNQAIDRLIEVVLSVHTRIQAQRSGLVGPNGHRRL